MESALSGFIGAIFGAVVALVATHLTNKSQERRTRWEDERALRDRRHDRLREAYLVVVSAAEGQASHATIVGIAELQARETGNYEELLDKMNLDHVDVRAARAALLLEPEQDQEVLRHLTATSGAHLAFLAWVGARLSKGEELSSDEFVKRAQKILDASGGLAALARTRLLELQKPVGPT